MKRTIGPAHRQHAEQNYKPTNCEHHPDLIVRWLFTCRRWTAT